MKTNILNRPREASSEASSGRWAVRVAWTSLLLLLATTNLRAGGPNGVQVGSLCGGGLSPFYGYVEGNPITSTDAKFNTPMGLALNSSGDYLFVADYTNNKVRVVDLLSTTPPSHYYLTFTFAPIPGLTSGTITNPVGVALDANDYVYVLNRGNGRNGSVAVFDDYAYWVTNLVSGLTNANAIALDPADNAYVTASNRLFKITPTGSKTTVATVTNAGACLQGLVVLDSGMIAVCDSGRHGIYLINPTNGVISTNTGFNGAGDNSTYWQTVPNYPVSKALAKFNQPMGLSKAGGGMLVVADYGNNRVKAVDSVGTVTNLYGVNSSLWCANCAVGCSNSWPGWYDGPVTVPDACGDVSARLPNGVLFAPNGTVYVTEDYYHLIRTVTGTSLRPPPPPPPAAPTILGVLTNYGQVTLWWSASAGATSYNVKRSPNSGTNYAVIATISSTNYTDTGLLNGTTNYYVVSALGAGGEGPNSTEVRAITPLPPVPDPQIGYVDFPADSSPVHYTSVFHPVSSFVANNDLPIVIVGDSGSQTYYNYGPTGSVPDPDAASTSAPAGYKDGMTPSEVAYYSIAQVMPDLTIKAIGEKPDGSPNSRIAQARFQFITANPSTTGNNAAQFTVSDITAGAQMWYTTDGSNPTNAAPSLGPIPSGTTLSLQFLPGQSNLTFKVIAFRDNYKPSAVWINNFALANFVPHIGISPNSGYYPMGQTITVSSPNPNVYYTMDGSDPTTNSLPVTVSGNVGLIEWFNSTNDLTGLRVKAIASGAAGDTVGGQPATTNTIGVPPDADPAIYAGIGSQIVVPVVANLRSNTTIQSYQFRVEIAPVGSAQPILGFDALNLTTNDFVPLAGISRPGTVGTVSYSQYTIGSTNGLEIWAVGNTNNVFFQNFAVVALLRIAIPYGAGEGDSYSLVVSYPSATSDGVAAAVPLTPMAPVTILVTNLAYKVGDSASFSGGWYNAGGFGNGDLDNSDVNLAFYASLGIRIPFAFSDVFNAMDAYPVDAPGFVGGDGLIRYLDWNVILQRSLRLDTNNWARSWSADGDLADVPTTLKAYKSMARVSQAQPAPTWPWYRQALVGAVSTGNAVPGGTVHVPVYLKLSDGAALSGIQFRAVVTPQGGAPPLAQPPQLSLASGVPGPTLQQSFGASGAGFGWVLGSFNYLSRSSNFLGWVTFTIPATAQSGQTYSVSFANADGAPNLSVQYDFETRSACVAVGNSAPPASVCSDEWKIHFFGSLTNLSASDLADPDGDGIPNWMEYLAGTDPADSSSRLQLSVPTTQAGKAQSQQTIQWVTAPGKAYEVQWSPNLAGGVWTTLATVSGDGTVASCSDTNIIATVRYYRLHLLP